MWNSLIIYFSFNDWSCLFKISFFSIVSRDSWTISAIIKLYWRNSVSKYPPLYERLIWDHKNADIPSINRANDIFDWCNSFAGKTVHEQVHFSNKTILNIFHNLITNKTILYNDKNQEWLNNEIRKMLTKKMRYSNSIYWMGNLKLITRGCNWLVIA